MQEETIRIRIWPFVVIFFLMAALAVSLATIKLLVNPYFLAGVFILSLLLYIIKRHNKIIVSPGGISYKTPLSTVKLNWNEVVKICPATQLFTHTVLFNWTIKSAGNKHIVIPMGHYSRQGMRRLAEAFVKYCPYALISPSIEQAAKGKLPWYIF